MKTLEPTPHIRFGGFLSISSYQGRGRKMSLSSSGGRKDDTRSLPPGGTYRLLSSPPREGMTVSVPPTGEEERSYFFPRWE